MIKPFETSLNELSEHYGKLAEQVLSVEGRFNNKIFLHAMCALASGYTPEQAVIRSHLFDIALRVDKAQGIRERMDIIFSLAPTLAIFKEWKDKNLISRDFLASATSAMIKVTDINKEQALFLKEILKELDSIVI